MAAVRPFVMFQGGAEAALSFYVSLFADGEVREIERYGDGEAGLEGTVKRAVFAIGGQEIVCIDSPVQHAFGFTPAISLAIECSSAAEIDQLAAVLAQAGHILMPLGDYGFSRRFAWVTDRFGLSWQLNLA